jgi:hypothetical protein
MPWWCEEKVVMRFRQPHDLKIDALVWGWRSLCSTSLQPRQPRQVHHLHRDRRITDIPTSRSRGLESAAFLHGFEMACSRADADAGPILRLLLCCLIAEVASQ